MKFFFNIIYYFLWRFFYINGRFHGRIADTLIKPFKWLVLKIPAARNRLIKLHGSIENAEKEEKRGVNYVFNNKEIGFATQFANGLYVSSFGFYFLGLCFVAARYIPFFLDLLDTYKLVFMIGFFGIAAVITHFVTFEKKAYKKYFKEFDKINGWERFAYKLMTFVFVTGSGFFWIWAMIFSHN